MIDTPRLSEDMHEALILMGGLLQILIVMGLYVLDRPSLPPVPDLGWHTLALIQSVILLGAIVGGVALKDEMRLLRLRLDDLETDQGETNGGVER